MLATICAVSCCVLVVLATSMLPGSVETALGVLGVAMLFGWSAFTLAGGLVATVVCHVTVRNGALTAVSARPGRRRFPAFRSVRVGLGAIRAVVQAEQVVITL